MNVIEEYQHRGNIAADAQHLAKRRAPVAPSPREVCIHALFEAQALRQPEATALVHEGRTLTYAELNRRANRLAHHLRTLGVGPDRPVAVLVERSLEMVVALLAVLKAGGAYVPLDLAAPIERLAYMLQDTAPAALLVDANSRRRIALEAGAIPVLDLQGDARAWAHETDTNPGCASIGLSARHLAYIIYTSGSTGVPKGVMVEHRNVVALVADNTFAPIDSDDCIAHCANPAFDASTWEVWAALLNGARLHVLSQRAVLEPALLNRQLCEGGVTALWLTVALFNTCVDELGEAFGRLKYLIVGGDALNPRMIARLLGSGHAPRHLLNGYGPTETTTFASTFEIERVADSARGVPIGKPIAHTQIYILDEKRVPVPVGVTGEIYIGGAGVARGYLNRQDLTEHRFVADPFAGLAGARMYRTGDLGRWLGDRNIECLGRNDQQVKLRGFRIELGEIEARLEACAGIGEAVVVAREDVPGDKRLVAYVTARSQAPVSVSRLRSELAAALPDYMLPSAIVRMETLPLTPNGKLDRKALPAPDAQAYASRDYEAPLGETERTLAGVWAELLGLERVGRHDDFFELGGHSLLAARVVGRLHKQLGLSVAVHDLFAHPTLAGFAALLAGATQSVRPTLLPAGRTRPLALSSAQERLWFLDQLDGGAGRAYHLPFAYRLTGGLRRESLQWALTRLVQRHESLRTSFSDAQGTPVQVIVEAGRFDLQTRDLSQLAAAAREAAARELLVEESHRPFDLSAGPLLRAMLLRLAPDVHELLLVQHHIVSDGWSVGVMLHELAALYNAHARGEDDPLPALALQYADYAAWQTGEAQQQGVRDRLPFWRESLRGAPALLELPTDRPRPARQSYRGDALAFSLGPELTAGLHSFGRRHGVTLFMSLLAGWSALLSRLSGQDDVVVGTPVANRAQPELEPLIGFFVNTLALRVRLADDPRVSELVAQVRQHALAAYAHQDVPFGQVVEVLRPKRSLDHNPLFQTMLALNNTPNAGSLALQGLGVRASHVPRRSTQFDLSLSFDEAGPCLQGHLEYACDLFEPESVQRMAEHFRSLLAAMVAGDSLRVSQLPLLSDRERQRLLVDFNATAADYPRGACIHQLFEAQAARTPDAIAVLHEGLTLSYAELNRRANRLAHHLKTLGVGPDIRVAICVERGHEMLIGLLAILKAGGAYVPLDPAYPADRLAHMLRDSAPAVVLVHESGAALDTGTVPSLDLHADASVWAHQADTNPSPDPLRPDHLAYVIYTSGSTGTPKGVMVEHASVVNLVHTHARICALGEADTLLQFASFSFDSSVEEFFTPLSVGAKLVLRPKRLIAPDEAFLQLLHEQRVTVVELPTAFWHQWAQLAQTGLHAGIDALRLVVVGGEKVERRHFDKWRAGPLGQRCQWLNSYGPTEATVYASALLVDARSVLPEGEITIGRPSANTRIYILDKQGQPVPIRVPGEIHIGGVQVARGYLNRPEQTAERFIADPFCEEPGARLYKTGDLGRWRADGSIEYLSRNDHQVKIRGLRIELGEIEARLAEYPSVREAVVLAREDMPGEKRLVAYLSLALPGALDIDALRKHLGRDLPEYMVPAAYVALDCLPLTPNGKLDRKALPAPDAGAYATREYEAPVGDVEATLARLWAELLKHERVGRHDNFFELGGHSLLAATQTSRLRSELQVEVALKDLFAHPVLSAFAQVVKDAARSELAPIPAAPRDLPLPLSFAQQRLWFLAQMGGVSEAYHMPMGLRLSGDLDRAALKQALDRIVWRHEALRTSFRRIGGEPMQHVSAPGTGFALQQHDLSDRADLEAELEPRMAGEASLPFDLERGPLIRGQLLRLAECEHLLLITMHHIVSDGWSFGVLTGELNALYRAYSEGREDPLPPLPIQYADYAVWQRQWLTGEVLRRQSAYWRQALQGVPTLLGLPTDRPRPAEQSFQGARVALALDAGLTGSLKALAQRHGMTLYMTVLAAWAALLARLSGQDDVVIGTSMANRTRTEIEALIGFFVNSQAMRVQVAGSVAGLLQQVKATALGAQEHQELPFEEVMEIVKPPRSLSHTAIFQVMLSWQNADEGSLSLPGLTLSPASPAYDVAKFDLVLELGEHGDLLVGGLVYATALFDRGTIERHAGYLRSLLAAMVADDALRVSQLPLLSDHECRRLLVDFNATAVALPRGACIHQMFEAQAARTPQAIAVVHEARRLSYAELNRQANRLAHHLKTLGVGPDTRVAICAERSPEMLVGLLAILKAGGAYVPLDPAYPADRLAHMLRDSAPAVVLVYGSRRALDTGTVPVLDLRADASAWADEAETDPSLDDLRPDHLAYVIYTSGSTGAPKGVMVEHASVVNLIHAHVRNCALSQADAVLQFASFSFDASVEEIFAPLAVGARIVLRPQRLVAPDEAFLQLLREQRITVAELPTAFWHQWAQQEAQSLHAGDDDLRLVVVGGEKVERRHFDKWRAGPLGQRCQWLNTYGPTEATVYASALRVDGRGVLPEGEIAIGRPGANTQIYILDKQGQPVPIGVSGEIHIGGVQVARGYLHRAELTAERFIADPFSNQPGARLYKTGDLGRWRSDGNIETLGRNDHQVKIRGFRIELGEIEARLAEHASVREAVVLAREDSPGDKRLVAYLTLALPEALDIEAIRKHLGRELPEHMVPAAYVQLESLPVTTNGKLDRKALPAPHAAAYVSRGYEAPVGEVETTLARLWAELLKRERVGRHDNFFELGGHSLLAITLVEHMRRADLQTEVRNIFAAPTLAALADLTEEIQELVL